jgi:hypothetical protein
MQHVFAAAASVLGTLALACGAPVIQPGLANAPALGGAQIVDPRVHDAIANGLDSCGRHLDPGPLRYKVPPCPSLAPSAPRVSFVPPSDGEWEVRWLEHYYVGWPCPHPKSVSDGQRLMAWSPTDLRASHCDLP